MFKQYLEHNYGSGKDYEIAIQQLLLMFGINAVRTKGDDKGVDIIADMDYDENTHLKFYIQCKFQNSVLNSKPIQEVFTGTHIRGCDGYPVVITNNDISAGAKKVAVDLGVEVIAYSQWKELQLASEEHRVYNQTHYGLLGILLGYSNADYETVEKAVAGRLDTPFPKNKPLAQKTITDIRKEKLQEKFDRAIICEQEIDKHQQSIARHNQKIQCLKQQRLALEKEAMLQNLEYL